MAREDKYYLDYIEDPKLNLYLKYFDAQPNKTEYIRIQVLDWNEKAIDGGRIEGKVTSGSLNLNGTSTVRRNGSLSLVVAEDDIFYKVEDINNLFSLNKKVKIEKGFDIDFYYDENFPSPGTRLWFPLGIFIIKNPSVNRSLSGLTLSLSLSDKMSLLNGENGGNFPAAVVFSETDEQGLDGTYTKKYNKIYDIIKSIVVDYGGIPKSKVKISDVDDTTLQVVKWGGSGKIYKYKQNNSYFIDTELPEAAQDITTYESNSNIGFISTDFIWPGATLTANAGETITTILDKIKTLGDYEYFFDIEGNFIWQKKKTYLYGEGISVTTESFYTKDELINQAVIPKLNTKSNAIYDFTDLPLIISYSNSPQYNNIKNDYIIWGKRTTNSGSEMSIRYHILLDKPLLYDKDKDTAVKCYSYLVAEPDVYGYKMVIEGGDISEAAVPDQNHYYTRNGKKYIYDIKTNRYKEITLKEITFSEEDDWRTLLYFRGKRAEANGETQTYSQNPLYKDLEIEWPKLYDMGTKKWKTEYPDGDTIDYYCHIVNGGDNLNYSSVGRYLTKVLNDTNINCIYSPDIGNNLILKLGEEIPSIDMSYTVVRVSDEIYSNIYTGGSQNSAFEQARTLVTQNTNYANTISISSIPLYHLEPNTLIQVYDEESSIDGTYVINTVSLPLTYNGTMTISASRALVSQ